MIYMLLSILRRILQAYMFVLVLTAILSWVDIMPMKYEARQKVYRVRAFLMKFISPITDRLDKIFKPIQLGGINLSLSFIILFFLIMLADNLLIRLAWVIYQFV